MWRWVATVALVVAGVACNEKKPAKTAAAPDAGTARAGAPATAGGPAADARPAGADARPTTEDCDRAIAHMKKISPALIEGDEEDRRECLKLPREVVLCLQGIATEAEAEACVARYAARQPARGHDDLAEAVAPEELATAEECRRLVEHLEGLLPAEQRDEETEGGLLDECIAQYTKTDVACLLAAKTLAEVNRCTEEP